MSGLAAAKEKVAALVKDQHQLLESVRSDDRFLVQLKEVREKLQSLETAHGVYGKIADVACGDNQLRNTLQRFVQGALPRGAWTRGLQQKSRVGGLTGGQPVNLYSPPGIAYSQQAYVL